MRGGKLIAFMDPQSENDKPARSSQVCCQQGRLPMLAGVRSSTMGPLVDAWGVQFDLQTDRR